MFIFYLNYLPCLLRNHHFMETSLGIDDPVKSFVKNNPQCAKVFEELNIDFCCGGDTSLLTACEEEDLEPHWVYQRLVELQQRLRPEKKMFQI